MPKAPYSVARTARDVLEERVQAASTQLHTYPKGPDGRTPDDVRATAEWQNDKAAYDQVFAQLKSFNKDFAKLYKTEIAEERKARFSAPSP